MQPVLTALSILVSHKDSLIRLGILTALRESPLGLGVRACLPDDADFDDLLRSADVVVTDYDHGTSLLPSTSCSPGSTTRHAQIFVVSNRVGEHEIRTAVDLGIRGYVFDDCRPEELIDGIGIVAKGTRHLCSTAAHRMVDSISREALTKRELEVLRCLVDGYVNKHISTELSIALGTVKAHVKSIFSKLDVSTRMQAVAVARRRGIVSVPPLMRLDRPRVKNVRSDRRPRPTNAAACT